MVFLTLLRTNGTGVPYFYLYNPDGTLASGSFISGGYVALVSGLRLTKTGTYTVVAIENGLAGTYDYLLSLTKVAGGVNLREGGDGAEAIVPGQITSGHISPADMDTFTFSGTSNDVVFLSLLRTNATGVPYFYLYNPDGTLASGSGTSGGYLAFLSGLRLTQTGTYTVVAIENSWAGTYDYLLSFTKVADGVNQREGGDGAEAIVAGQITGGHISPADMDTFTFNGTSNDVVFLSLLRTNGTGVPYFYLYAPDGTVASGATISGGYVALVSGLRLTKTGTYTVVAIENSWAGTYDYLLSFTKVAGDVNQREGGDGAEAIVPGQITSGHISPVDMDTFTFGGTSNDVVFLSLLRTNGTGVPYFYLYAPDGTLAAGANISGGYLAFMSGLRLTKTGTYTVVAIENSWAGTYDYLLSFTVVAGGVNQREAGDGAEAIVPGQVTSGHIGPADMDTFTFSGTSNDVVFLSLLRTNVTGAPYFYLYNPDGTLAAGSGISGGYLAFLNGLRLTKTGTYTVVAIENSWTISYDYNLCLFKNPGPNFPEPGEGAYVIAPGETRSAQITPGDFDVYAFHAIAGDTITIQLQKTSGAGLNPVVQLHAPDGTMLASAVAASAPRIRFECVPQTGTYLILVLANSHIDSFGYSISLGQSPIVPPSSGTNQYLAVYVCDHDLILRWETNSTGFILESTLSLPATNWFPVAEEPQILFDHFYVHQGVVTNQTQYYRLRCTNCVSGFIGP